MKILGHRGIITTFETPYQNSLKSFEEALSKTDGFETDACLSKDGEIFFIHEAKYYDVEVEVCYKEHLHQDNTPKAERFDQLTSDEISQIKLKDGQTIPNWDETLKLFTHRPEKTFNIELKGYNVHFALIPKLKDAIHKGLIKEEQLVISSFNHRALIDIREAFPNIQIGVLYIDPALKPAYLFPWTDNRVAAYEPINEETIQATYLKNIEPEFVIIPDSCATDQTFQLINTYLPKCKVVVWVFTELDSYDEQAFKGMIKRQKTNLHAIIIDNPDTNYFTT